MPLYVECGKILLCNSNKVNREGSNGAGKTTFVKLLTGLYEPSEGQIFINGIDSRDFDRDEYYRLFSVVFQDIKTVAGLLYVLFELSPIIIALIVLIVIVNTITEKMRQDKDFIFWADNAENNKLFGYLASQVVYDYNAGKYIRLYNVVPLIMERYRKFDRNSLKLFKNIANTDYRFMSISIILGKTGGNPL